MPLTIYTYLIRKYPSKAAISTPRRIIAPITPPTADLDPQEHVLHSCTCDCGEASTKGRQTSSVDQDKCYVTLGFKIAHSKPVNLNLHRLSTFFHSQFSLGNQQAHDVVMTLACHRCDVLTSHRR